MHLPNGDPTTEYISGRGGWQLRGRQEEVVFAGWQGCKSTCLDNDRIPHPLSSVGGSTPQSPKCETTSAVARRLSDQTDQHVEGCCRLASDIYIAF